MRSDALPFLLGTTEDSTTSEGLAQILGREYMVTDDGKFDVLSLRRATNLKKRVRLVKNSSGVPLNPQQSIRYKPGTNLSEVDGYTAITSENSAGIVDEFLQAPVPVNHYFFVTIDGPTLYKNDPAASSANFYSIGDKLAASTAAASTAGSTAGRLSKVAYVAATDVTSAGSLASAVSNIVLTALSASTTGETNASKLGLIHYSL